MANLQLPSKRLAKELAELHQEMPENILQAFLVNNNLFHWEAVIAGPSDTPYAGGQFKISLFFSPDYPCKPPKVKFITKVFHCNINSLGGVCLNILKEEGWSPALTVRSVLMSIIQLLGECNPYDGLSPNIAKLYLLKKDVHDKMAKMWTEKYAM